jgi:hypothetical protein
MLNSKKLTLAPLLESANGIHLTVYLVNNGDIIDFKSQLRESINHSYEWLYPAMTPKEAECFLEPLYSLLEDARVIQQMTGNIGLFRKEDSFRILNIPIEIEPAVHVATSFHIKPLLKWLQNDREFILIGLAKNHAWIYSGSQYSLKLVDSAPIPDFSFALKTESQQLAAKETVHWLNEWIFKLAKKNKPKLFFAGNPKLIETIGQSLEYKNKFRTSVAKEFQQSHLGEYCNSIRDFLADESNNIFERTLMEFRLAEAENRATKNIFQISKAVVKGKVKKLIVTDELCIFGKIDKKSGGLAIHPFDLDHEDDDILDDLAQMVLSQGGEVIVAPRDKIPKGRPILAILGQNEAEKSKEFQQSEILLERFG